MFKNLTLGLIAAASFISTACAIDVQGEESVVREERRLTLNGAPQLTISTFDGAVELRSWDRNEVLVEIERHASSDADAKAIEVTTSEDRGRVVVEAVNHRGRDVGVRFGRSPSVHLIVTTPRMATIDARSGDGPITARDLSGRINLRTGDGSVRTQRLDGEIRVDTGDGPVSISEAQGAVDVNTGDGAVDVSGRLEALRINSGDGPIRIDAAAGSTMTRDWSISSGDGSIALRLPQTFNAELDAHTGDGHISASGLSAELERLASEHGELRTRLGSGGRLLRLRTGDGPISISTH